MEHFTLKATFIMTAAIALSTVAYAGDSGCPVSDGNGYKKSNYSGGNYKNQYVQAYKAGGSYGQKNSYEQQEGYGQSDYATDKPASKVKTREFKNNSGDTTVVAANQEKADSKASDVLTDEKGMTLYIFDKDKPGVSNCYGDCADNWPPYLGKDNAQKKDSEFSLVDRKGGGKQWAYKNQPLYFWAGDQNPGDKSGDGVGGVWHIIKK